MSGTGCNGWLILSNNHNLRHQSSTRVIAAYQSSQADMNTKTSVIFSYKTFCAFFFSADECSTIADCVEDSNCVNSPDGFVCLCPFGFMGDGRTSGNGCFADQCSIISDCVENATCINSADSFVCLCPFGFMGDGRMSGNGCFLDECSSTSNCVENATCVNSPDGFICVCPFGFMGDGMMSGNGCNGWFTKKMSLMF